MTTPSADLPPRVGRGPHPAGLVASMLDDDPAVGVLLLAGRFGPYEVAAAGEHMTQLLGRGVRDVSVEAGSLSVVPHAILELFVRTQAALADRGGLLRIFGLRAEAVLPATADGRVMVDAGPP